MALRQFLGWSNGELMRLDAKPCSTMIWQIVGIFSVCGALEFWTLHRVYYDIVQDSSSLLPHYQVVYGMPGLGKKTLGKEIYRLNLRNFDASLYYLDFSGDCAPGRLKLVQEDLTESIMSIEDDAQNLCRALVNGKKVLLDPVFDAMLYKCRTIFLLLTTRLGPKMSTEETYKWLQQNYNGGFENIKKAVSDLCDNAFIEEIETEIYIHYLFKEFAYSKHKDNLSTGRYPLARMHGGARMCQELADLFKTVHQNEKGNRIVGLYGMPGQGKTTLCKTFCNLNLQNFDGKVCYLDFGQDKRCRLWSRLTTEYQAYGELQFHGRDRNERELLVLDNITGNWQDYEEVNTHFEGNTNSWFLLIARSEDVLVEHFWTGKQSCMRIPALEEEEALAILLERVFPVEPKLGEQDRGFALKCAQRCLFKDNAVVAPTFHPFAEHWNKLLMPTLLSRLSYPVQVPPPV